jgi:hypothetical protein
MVLVLKKGRAQSVGPCTCANTTMQCMANKGCKARKAHSDSHIGTPCTQTTPKLLKIHKTQNVCLTEGYILSLNQICKGFCLIVQFTYFLCRKQITQAVFVQTISARFDAKDVKYSMYSETIYRSQIIRFPGSIVQFLWSLSESYLNYGSRIYCFPGSIVSFSYPQ